MYSQTETRHRAKTKNEKYVCNLLNYKSHFSKPDPSRAEASQPLPCHNGGNSIRKIIADQISERPEDPVPNQYII